MQSSSGTKATYEDPILYEQFTLPVVAPDGWTYELGPIVQWLKKGNNFFPQSRQSLPDEVIFYPNFTLAQDMVDQKLLAKLPFDPGQAWRFQVNISNEKNQKEFQNSKFNCSLFSALDISINLFCTYLAYQASSLTNFDNVLANVSMLACSASAIASAFTFGRMFTLNSPYLFRKILGANLVLGFMTEISNTAFLTTLTMPDTAVTLSQTALLFAIPKTIFYACNLISEMNKVSFFFPAKQTSTNRILEIA